MFRLLTVLCACAALGLGATPALADDELPITSKFFEEYDHNSDGVVSSDEFGGSADVFRLLDKDGDGKIQAAELGLPADYRPSVDRTKKGADGGGNARRRKGGGGANARADRLKKALADMDANKDGKVTKAEWKGNDNLFSRLDRNADGVIDAADAGDGMAMDGMDGDDPMSGDGDGDRKVPGGGVKGAKPNKGPRGDERAGAYMERVKQMDADGDGHVSRDEWKGRPATFDRLDRDGDGVIGEAELAPPEKTDGRRGPITPEQANERFKQLDTDGDGELTDSDELPGRFARLVRRMDADESGGVSLEEFQAGVSAAQRGDARERKAGGATGPSREVIRRFDNDRDGRVSRDEFPGSDERFDGMDTNGDGYLSAADATTPKGPVTAEKSLVARLDKDGDGRLNRAEFDGSDEAWSALDKNADGWVTKAEAGE